MCISWAHILLLHLLYFFSSRTLSTLWILNASNMAVRKSTRCCHQLNGDDQAGMLHIKTIYIYIYITCSITILPPFSSYPFEIPFWHHWLRDLGVTSPEAAVREERRQRVQWAVPVSGEELPAWWKDGWTMNDIWITYEWHMNDIWNME